jgi:hypothetical protein
MTLSVTIAEFLTGSTPVITIFLSPIALPFLFGLYGCGVATIREVCVRWSKGWPTVLLLGAAYGIAEEGFGTKTFFDPQSSVVGALGSYGHFAGVNWVWAFQLTIFHSLFSIGLPILLIGLLFPTTRGERLVGDRGLLELFLLFLATAGIMFVLFDRSYTPSATLLLLFGGIVLVLVLIAFRAPSTWSTPSAALQRARLPKVAIVGGLFVWSFFAINWILPAFIPFPILLIGLELGLCGAAGWAVLRNIESGNPRDRLALAAGMLSFLVVLSMIETIIGDVLAILATAGVFYLLFSLYRRTDPRRGAILPSSGMDAS